MSEYAAAYQKVMDQNVAAIKKALANKRKNYNAAEGQKLIAQFTQQKKTVWNDARSIIRGLVRSAASASPLKDALLLEAGSATYIPRGQDKTDELISAIDRLKLNVPAPPKPIEIK